MTVAAGFVARSALPTSPAPAVARRRPLLAVVPAGEPDQRRAPFAAGVVALLVLGLFGLLVLNTVLAKDAFKLHALQVEGRKLADTEQVLTREVESLRAPAALAEKAAAMGMVQAGPPSFLRLPDGAVLGSAEPAQAPVAEGEPVPAPQAQAAPQPVSESADDENAPAGAASETDSETTTDETGTDSGTSSDTEEETPEDG